MAAATSRSASVTTAPASCVVRTIVTRFHELDQSGGGVVKGGDNHDADSSVTRRARSRYRSVPWTVFGGR